MAKRPPRRTTRAPLTASSVTSQSSPAAILRAKVLTHLEIIGRQAFAELQALEAQLADMPPLAPREPPPANEG